MFHGSFARMLPLRIPRIFGAGETITHLADVPEQRRAEYVDVGFEEPAIGYQVRVLPREFLDLWTGRGDMVLFDESSGIRSLPLTDAQVLGIIGETVDDLGKPFFYRVPVGWIVLDGLAGFYGVGMVRDARDLG